MTPDRRRTDTGGTLLGGLVERIRRIGRRQTQFSAMSSALAAVLAITMLVDIVVGHPHIEQVAVAVWLVTYLALTALPLRFGSAYPRWAGLLFVAFLTFWSAFSLVRSNHPHMELNALLEAPMVAVYLGWFYRPGIARACLALHLAAVSLAVLLRPTPDEPAFSSSLALLYALLISVFCLETGSYIHRRAERQARRDPLTDALNRRGLVLLGERALALAERSGESLVLAIVDLDDFKEVNDAGGHAAGDEALRACSAAWARGLGPRDLVARIGGDEFALVIHADERAAAERLARLRAESPHVWTWGLAERAPGDTLDRLMLRADEALYRGKAARGR